MSSLSAQTLGLLNTTFAALGHCPSEPMWRGIEDLTKHLELMADGGCEPRFYLSSLDPGVGKTQTIIHFLRALLASPEHEHVGVIIFLFTKQQIEEVVSQAKLNPADYAVLMTAEDKGEQKLIDSGAPDPSTARVVFTTQQRLQLLCKDKNFSDVEVYRFRRRPRQVRIWDEALSPAAEVVVRAYAIPDLLHTMSGVSPEFASALERLRDDVQASDDRTVFFVPNLAASHRVSLKRFLGAGRRLTQDERKFADNLWFLFGRYASVRDDGYRGKALVSFRQSLPDDLSPLVVLDASGRVKTAYEWWERHRDNLVRLGTAPKRYDNLTVHVWDRGGGQSSFEAERDRLRRTSGIIQTINSRPSERWLVICHMAHRDNIERDVRRELVDGDPTRVNFIHWGIHRASNEFCDVRNIILAGTQFLPPSAYEGIGRAARGLQPEEGQITDAMQRDIELGETADRVLQAACRGVVRKAVGDKCPPCDVYIMATSRSGVRDQLRAVFPGCQIETWSPGPPHMPKKARKAFEFIDKRTAERLDWLLPVKMVMEHIDETNKANFNRDVLKRVGFRVALEEAGISVVSRGRARIGFQRDFDASEDETEDPADIFRTTA